jgi:hypothetical protein
MRHPEQTLVTSEYCSSGATSKPVVTLATSRNPLTLVTTATMVKIEAEASTLEIQIVMRAGVDSQEQAEVQGHGTEKALEVP